MQSERDTAQRVEARRHDDGVVLTEGGPADFLLLFRSYPYQRAFCALNETQAVESSETGREIEYPDDVQASTREDLAAGRDGVIRRQRSARPNARRCSRSSTPSRSESGGPLEAMMARILESMRRCLWMGALLPAIVLGCRAQAPSLAPVSVPESTASALPTVTSHELICHSAAVISLASPTRPARASPVGARTARREVWT
jgi:hypothetical protein